MWRHAHGRLAAIAVLAGGLSSCMPTPRHSPPTRTEADIDDESDHEHVRSERPDPNYFICGGVIPRDRSPAALTADLGQLTRNCFSKGDAGKYGEVRVAWSKQAGISVDTTRTHGLTEEDRHCIDGAARMTIHSGEEGATDLPDGLTIDAWFGELPPLLPPAPELAAEWQAAIASPGAREQLRSKLPDEAVLEDDGCISFPYRPAFMDRLRRWLETAGTPMDAVWDRSYGREGLFAEMVNGQSEAHVYVLPEKGVIVQRTPWPPRPHWAPNAAPEVCMRPWDEKLRRQIRARIEQRASCTTGDVTDMLLHPRAGVPTGRPFKSVSVGPTRVCAIDEKGRLACCGERTQQDIPAATFTDVAVGTGADCGVTVAGDMYCWGYVAPAFGTVIKGPFAQVYLADRGVCAIRRDTRTLDCWDPDVGRMVTVLGEKVRSAVGGCALLEAGPVLCRDPNGKKKWYELKGSFRTLDATQYDVCGVTGPGDAIACAQRWPDRERPSWFPPPPRPPAVAGPAGIVLSGSDGCVVDRSGHLTCWPQARNKWNGTYRMIAAWGDRFCAVTADGRVECDREVALRN